MHNILYHTDCKDVILKLIQEGITVDLIYLDPPFNSKGNYYTKDKVLAFSDVWRLDQETEETIEEIRSKINPAFLLLWNGLIDSLRISKPSLLAYLSFLTTRLIEMHNILKPTGTIYLHCDPTASHYIKVIMDGIFGHNNFRNEIAWCYKKWNIKQSKYPSNHDIILFYSKNFKKYYFNTLYIPKSEKSSSGSRTIKSIVVDGKRKSVYLDEESKGTPMPDWWDVAIINPMSKERLGYPTQKPLALLDRIIKASCPPDGIILDPFCGCGTTVISAQQNKRKWIGIDTSIDAIRIAKLRIDNLKNVTESSFFEVYTNNKRNCE